MVCIFLAVLVAVLTAATNTVAAGISTSAPPTTLAEAWNGANWTIQPTPNPGGTNGSTLLAVSCLSTSLCTAVGYYHTSAGTGLALAETWNGTSWTTRPIPSPAGASYTQPTDVSCTSVAACTTVGYYTNSAGVPVTLAERWNGTSWTIQSTPNPAGATRSQLLGVSCASATACTAVGYYIDSAGAHATLAEAWDGTSWTIQPTPNASGASYSILRDVSCASATACTADWYYIPSTGNSVALVERWNGANWTIQPTPTPAGATSSLLRGVSCASTVACTAVGYYTNSAGAELTSAEAWNGTSWAIQPSPNPTTATKSLLKGVSCPSTAACTAVGDYITASGVQLTLAEGWSAAGWTIQSTPNPTGPNPTLSGVSCSSATACTAVGSA